MNFNQQQFYTFQASQHLTIVLVYLSSLFSVIVGLTFSCIKKRLF